MDDYDITKILLECQDVSNHLGQTMPIDEANLANCLTQLQIHKRGKSSKQKAKRRELHKISSKDLAAGKNKNLKEKFALTCDTEVVRCLQKCHLEMPILH